MHILLVLLYLTLQCTVRIAIQRLCKFWFIIDRYEQIKLVHQVLIWFPKMGSRQLTNGLGSTVPFVIRNSVNPENLG